jgi:hypothetical protein
MIPGLGHVNFSMRVRFQNKQRRKFRLPRAVIALRQASLTCCRRAKIRETTCVANYPIDNIYENVYLVIRA